MAAMMQHETPTAPRGGRAHHEEEEGSSQQESRSNDNARSMSRERTETTQTPLNGNVKRESKSSSTATSVAWERRIRASPIICPPEEADIHISPSRAIFSPNARYNSNFDQHRHRHAHMLSSTSITGINSPLPSHGRLSIPEEDLFCSFWLGATECEDVDHHDVEESKSSSSPATATTLSLLSNNVKHTANTSPARSRHPGSAILKTNNNTGLDLDNTDIDLDEYEYCESSLGSPLREESAINRVTPRSVNRTVNTHTHTHTHAARKASTSTSKAGQGAGASTTTATGHEDSSRSDDPDPLMKMMPSPLKVSNHNHHHVAMAGRKVTSSFVLDRRPQCSVTTGTHSFSASAVSPMHRQRFGISAQPPSQQQQQQNFSSRSYFFGHGFNNTQHPSITTEGRKVAVAGHGRGGEQRQQAAGHHVHNRSWAACNHRPPPPPLNNCSAEQQLKVSPLTKQGDEQHNHNTLQTNFHSTNNSNIKRDYDYSSHSHRQVVHTMQSADECEGEGNGHASEQSACGSSSTTSTTTSEDSPCSDELEFAATQYLSSRLVQLITLMNMSPAEMAGPDGQRLKPNTAPPSSKPHVITLDDVTDMDVVLGRGCGINNLAGNKQYRKLVQTQQPMYRRAHRKEKPRLARAMVEFIRNHMNGRFLKKDQTTQLFFDVGDTKAETKTGQALREGFCGLLQTTEKKKTRRPGAGGGGSPASNSCTSGVTATMSMSDDRDNTPSSSNKRRKMH
jgi:hypothetical protein